MDIRTTVEKYCDKVEFFNEIEAREYRETEAITAHIMHAKLKEDERNYFPDQI
jgi:hypothetical protein